LKEEQKFSREEIMHLKKENSRLKQELDEESKLKTSVAKKTTSTTSTTSITSISKFTNGTNSTSNEHSITLILQQRTNASRNMLVDIQIAFLLKQYLLGKNGNNSVSK